MILSEQNLNIKKATELVSQYINNDKNHFSEVEKQY